MSCRIRELFDSHHMPRFAAIADTNFYRSNTELSLATFRDLEHRANVRPMASFLASSELLSHVADPTSRDYRPCRAAVRRLFIHCHRASLHEPALPIIADPNGILALSLFGRQHPSRFTLAESFGTLIRRVANANEDDQLSDICHYLSRVRSHRDQVEARFVDSLENLRRQFGRDTTLESDFPPSERPTPDEFLASDEAPILCASAMVMNAASEHGITLDDSTLRQRAKSILPEAAAAVHIFLERLRKVLLEGASPRRQANFIWDIYFALLSGSHLSAGQAPVLVISDDKAIQRASEVAGGNSRVLSSSEYMALLNRLAAKP